MFGRAGGRRAAQGGRARGACKANGIPLGQANQPRRRRTVEGTDRMQITATIETRAFGPAVVVTVAGEAAPWEFACRAAAVRTPMRRRYTLARSIEFVRSRLEAQPSRASR